jgi:hypothetical protein
MGNNLGESGCSDGALKRLREMGWKPAREIGRFLQRRRTAAAQSVILGFSAECQF